MLRREEAYWGPHVGAAPELTIQWNRRVPVGRLTASAKSAGDFPTGQFRAISGDHRPEGVLMMAGTGILPGQTLEGASIMDLFPTILRLMGVSIPEGLDGKSLDEALSSDLPPAPGSPPDRSRPGPSDPEKPRYTVEEEEAVRERLRGLGYIE